MPSIGAATTPNFQWTSRDAGVHIDINISQCSGIVSSSSWYRSIPLTKRFQTVITTIEAKVVAKTGANINQFVIQSSN